MLHHAQASAVAAEIAVAGIVAAAAAAIDYKIRLF